MKRFLIPMVLFCCCCGTKYKLEKNVPFSFSKAYYKEWVAGAVGAGSGYHIVVEIASTGSDAIELKGVYFKGNYDDLKIQEDNSYQAFIPGTDNTANEDIMNGNLGTSANNEDADVPLPFQLNADEAVIAYSVKSSKIRYFKLLLEKKNTIDTPR